MDKYIQAENRLAELLWPDAYQAVAHLNAEERRWTRDNSAAFALMVEHQILVYPTELEVEIDRKPIGHDSFCVWYSDHPDKETAVRYAIVKACIDNLEESNNLTAAARQA